MARLRFAWRSLAKAPLLSLVVILSVGLGIGANTAIFSLLHQILLNSLPVDRPDELVSVTSPENFKGGRNSTNVPADPPPLGTIRSLAYFLPVIDEVIEMRVSPDYFQHVRRKLQQIARDR